MAAKKQYWLTQTHDKSTSRIASDKVKTPWEAIEQCYGTLLDVKVKACGGNIAVFRNTKTNRVLHEEPKGWLMAYAVRTQDGKLLAVVYAEDRIQAMKAFKQHPGSEHLTVAVTRAEYVAGKPTMYFQETV